MKQNRKKREAGRQTAYIIFWRTMILLVLFGVCLFIPLGYKLYQLQITQHDDLQKKATSQQTRDVTVSASRGTIYDCNGVALAVSATVYDVVLSPKDINTVSDDDLKDAYGDKYKDTMSETEIANAKAQIIQERVDLIATNLAQILDVDEDDIRTRCENTKSQYSLVKKKVESDPETSVRNFIQKYDLSSCIYLTTDTKRYYPYSTLAAQVIGFVNADNEGAYGVEAGYEDLLSGNEGRIVTAKNNAGTDLLYYYSDYYDAEDGDSVYLTIDSTIQSYCEKTLQEGIEKYQVQHGGWCVAMDPNTGAILGIASSPTYDLNDPSEIYDEDLLESLEKTQKELDQQVEAGEITQEEADTSYNEALANARYTQWTSKAVNNTYEPGSTFKSIVLAAALEEGAISESDYFMCTGHNYIDTWDIKCSNTNGHGSQILAEAVGNSCNSAFIQIGQKLGSQKFWEYLEDFGITERTGVDMPAEGIPQVWDEDEFVGASGIVNQAVASFGQRLTVNPIQLVTAVSATINGGYLYQPHVVSSVVDSNGNVVESNDATVVRQVVSEETSATVREMLEGVVSTYGGKNAYQAGYRIGGKTGTSQVGTITNRWVVSFIGFAPADDPQIIVLLAFDGPKSVEEEGSSVTSSTGACGVSIYGGYMAAPLAGELIADICDYLGVEKQYTDSEQAKADSTVPSVLDLTLENAATLLENANLSYRTVGSGDKVTAQVPAAGVTLSNGSEIVLYMGEDASTETVTMPDLTGMTPANAEYALTQLGLYFKGTGQSSTYNAQADSQSVEADAEVKVGTVVTVHFSDSAIEDVG